MKSVVEKLIAMKKTIATAESITGGLIAKLITDVSGSSAVIKESFVVYSNEAKVNILHVDKKLIDDFGVVSSEVAKDMCIKLKMLTNRDICVSTTGNAGPTVCDDKPVGRVYIGINYDDDVKVYECNFAGNRDEIRNLTAQYVFKQLENILC